MKADNYTKDFMDSGGRIWLNAASEGPLPIKAAEALKQSIVWKSLPYQLDLDKFARVPKELKNSLGKLLNVPGRDVILANSVSYGVHLLANGIDWRSGDEIILMQNDFPSDILPWLVLQQKGVRVIQAKPSGHVLTPEEFKDRITDKTKLFCMPHVHTFSGFKIDPKAFGDICQAHGIIFVLNVAQSAGAVPLDIGSWPVDAVVGAGYKWLCGPYGTGFAWIKPELRQQLNVNHAYWIPYLSDDELQSEGPLAYKELKTARQLDVFGTANFFNFVPFREAVDYFLDIGLDNVAVYHSQLIDQLINGLADSPYEIISPTKGEERSSLVFISHRDPAQNPAVFRRLQEQNIYLAFWKGRLRIAPHVYNTQEHINIVIKALINI